MLLFETADSATSVTLFHTSA